MCIRDRCGALAGGTYLVLRTDFAVPSPVTATAPLTGTNLVTTCTYSAEFLDAMGSSNPDIGLKVKSGTTILGPAIAQFDARSAVAIYPGVQWIATADVIVWQYEGNAQCLEAQFPYFPGKHIQAVR